MWPGEWPTWVGGLHESGRCDHLAAEDFELHQLKWAVVDPDEASTAPAVGDSHDGLPPLPAPETMVPPGETTKKKGVNLWRQRRREGEVVHRRWVLRVQVDSVRNGVGPRIPQLSECAWLQVSTENLVSLGR